MRQRQHPWVAPVDKYNRKSKKDYVPSHQREGFSERAVIKLPSFGEKQRAPGRGFIISRA
jgi:hypothetical protein